MQDDDFEWDDEKADSNFRKHHVSFVSARAAFDEPNWVEVDDFDPDEQRYLRLCMLDEQIYAIVYTDRDERIRLL